MIHKVDLQSLLEPPTLGTILYSKDNCFDVAIEEDRCALTPCTVHPYLCFLGCLSAHQRDSHQDMACLSFPYTFITAYKAVPFSQVHLGLQSLNRHQSTWLCVDNVLG
jgi:hypothetical protein